MRKGKKVVTTPAVVPDTDDESVIFGASEDEEMEDAGPLEAGTKDNNAIDIAPSKVSSLYPLPMLTLLFQPSLKKHKEDHAEAIHIPYIRNSSIDRTSRANFKAMKLFYEFVKSREDQQGLSVKQLSKLTPCFIDSAISTARTIVTSAQPEPSDDAIALQDLQVCTDLAVATHRIVKQLKMRDELYAERVRLIGVVKERKLAVPAGGPVFT
ncbi:hypothetical protein DFH09DRAFT_1349336 [Mycena vulgaris]|nr:hypothetical protein DFH09DRAFT_1349336 [Mycena vulgaris]